MTGFDYLVLSVVALSALLGLWRGLVSEVLALAAWVAAFYAARIWGHDVAGALSGWLHQPALREGVGLAVVFVATLLVFGVVRLVLSKLLRVVGLGFTDRFLGGLFGVLRGGLLVWLVVLVCGMSSLPRQPWWRNAWLAPPLETAVLAAKPWMPSALAQRIRYR